MKISFSFSLSLTFPQRRELNFSWRQKIQRKWTTIVSTINRGRCPRAFRSGWSERERGWESDPWMKIISRSRPSKWPHQLERLSNRSIGLARGKYLVCSRPVCARDSENSIKASERSALACLLARVAALSSRSGSNQTPNLHFECLLPFPRIGG